MVFLRFRRTEYIRYRFRYHHSKELYHNTKDAFATFKDVITKHKSLVSEFLDSNYDRFFEYYTKLLTSENYVTKRQSLKVSLSSSLSISYRKLLGELLLDRTNYSVMNRYISSPENLKLMMNLLRDKSRNIQFEAFHVFKVWIFIWINVINYFKVFVANPSKCKSVSDILFKNKDKLISYLTTFHTDRTGTLFSLLYRMTFSWKKTNNSMKKNLFLLNKSSQLVNSVWTIIQSEELLYRNTRSNKFIYWMNKIIIALSWFSSFASYISICKEEIYIYIWQDLPLVTPTEKWVGNYSPPIQPTT